MNVVFLYPSDPFSRYMCDIEFVDEYNAVKEAGFSTCLLRYDLLIYEERVRWVGQLSREDVVIYRGWMMTPDQYYTLYTGLAKHRMTMLVSPTMYELCHHLPKWYPHIVEYTAETEIVSKDDFIIQSDWDAIFVKDFVKSLGPIQSIANTPLEINDIVQRLDDHRGIEGGICLRKVEKYLPDSERRFFVYLGRVYSSDGVVPAFVDIVAKKIISPFFTIDVAVRDDGVMRVIEIGDGQVSGLKEWDNYVTFLEMFSGS